MSKRRAVGHIRIGICVSLLALCAFKGVLAQSNPEVHRLVEDLESKSPGVRAKAIVALGRIGPAAKEAVADLIAAFKDGPVRVRISAAEALGWIGPAAKEAVPDLVAALKERDEIIRSTAAQALGRIGPAAAAAIPDLIAALKDGPVRVRQSAAQALGGIGPAAKEAVPDLVAALKDGPVRVRIMAAQALGRIGPAAKEAVPDLVAALKERDAIFRGSVAQALGRIGPAAAAVPALLAALKVGPVVVPVLAAQALGRIGPAAKEAVAAIIADDKGFEDLFQSTAAEALGRIGPAAAVAIPALLAALNDGPNQVRAMAARAFGGIGPAAREAVPALLAALEDGDDVQLFAALALDRLARVISSRNEVDVAGRSQLQDALAVLRSLDGSERGGDVSDATVSVAAAVAHLSALEDSSLGLRLSRWFASLSLEDRRTWALIGVATWLAVVGVLFTIFMARPIWLLPARERFERVLTPRLNLESKWANLKGEIPVGPAISNLSLLRFFATRRRPLDAWVREHVVACRDNFGRLPTVKDREVFVPLAVKYDDRTILGPDFSARELRTAFGKKGRSIRLLIAGEGGAGKTSLACQLGRWAMADEKTDRLAPWLMLPVLIEEELDDKAIQEGLTRFTAKVRSKLQQLAGMPEPPSEDLLGRLLRDKRVLVIVDHFSEMGPETQKQIPFGDAAFPAAALTVTSRTDDALENLPKHVLRPPRIQGGQVASFLEGYLQERGKRDLFDDEDFFEACRRLTRMVGERDITVLLAKLYADQLIASKGGDSGGTGSGPLGGTGAGTPGTIPELMLGYLNEVNRAAAEGDPDNNTLHRDAKAIAWECLKQTHWPAPVERSTVLKAMKQKEVADFEAEARLKYYEERLRLIQVVGVAKDKIRFALDPLAEYLAAMKVVDRNWGSEKEWKRFLERADGMPGAPEAIKGFLLAVRDCCLATPDARVPAPVIEELGRRGGLDPDYVARVQRRRRLQRFIAELRSDVAEDRRHAAEILGGFGTDAVDAVPTLVACLKDDEARVRGAATTAVALICQEAAVPALTACLKDDEHVVYGAAVSALGWIGPAAVPALIACLKDDDADLRERAASALGNIGPAAEAAVPALIACLKDDDADLRERAASALGNIGPAAEAAVPALIACLKDDDARRGGIVATAVGRIGQEAAVPALIDALKDDDADLRRWAALALSAIGPAAESAVPALIDALKDDDKIMRRRAAEALGSIGRAAVPALSDALEDEDEEVQGLAERALGRIYWPETGVPALDEVPKGDEMQSNEIVTPGRTEEHANEAVADIGEGRMDHGTETPRGSE
jgi:HEAT repeat protein